MSLERVFKALASVSLSETDARVYIYLALKGPEKAGNVVDRLKISKQQIHRSLKVLQDKGIVFADKENQGVFYALHFEKALNLLIETEKTRTQSLRDTKESLLSDFKTATKKTTKNS